MSSFSKWDLPNSIIQSLTKQNITTPTPIQEKVYPAVLSGQDVMAQSHTGSGKTFAYLLPIMQKILTANGDYHALVLAPTRELCLQIVRAAESVITENSGVRVVALPGGADIARQIDRLKGTPSLLIGTPGRVVDLIKRRKLKAHLLKIVVVDEADQMIKMGFWDDVQAVIRSTLRDRQLAFFSATIPVEIEKTAAAIMKEPLTIRLDSGQKTAPGIEHIYLRVEKSKKLETLRRFVESQKPKAAIVFVSDVDDVRPIARELQFQGIQAEGLHGELSQLLRTNVMRDFRDGRLRVLVTSDVLSRGLDVPRISHVIHYDPAFDGDHYTHRAGRTARGSGTGMSITFVTPEQRFIIDKLEKALSLPIKPKMLYDGKLLDPKEQAATSSKQKPSQPTAKNRTGSQRLQTAGSTGGKRKKVKSKK